MKTIANHIVAIGAGKGGVGKSTITVNLAISLAQKNLRVGVLDADLYGPSIPIMLGLRQLSPEIREDGQIIPFTKYGIHSISLGCFLDEQQSIVWRGPMLHKMLQKLIQEVAWPPLDLLLIDLPPGTGDVPLSLSKLLKFTGAIVVTTPQQVAIQDVIKATHAFHQLHIPLLGLIENFSSYQTADGSIHYPFGKADPKTLAKNLSTSYLGQLPIQETIRQGADEGIVHPHFFEPLADKFLHTLASRKQEECHAKN